MRPVLLGGAGFDTKPAKFFGSPVQDQSERVRGQEPVVDGLFIDGDKRAFKCLGDFAVRLNIRKPRKQACWRNQLALHQHTQIPHNT